MKTRNIKSKNAKAKPAATEQTKTAVESVPANQEFDIPAPNAFLEDAKREPKRKLITDHVETIYTLRDEKRFTFREIAEWLTARGFETDHSAVYRAYMAAVPDEQRPRDQSWEEFDTPE